MTMLRVALLQMVAGRTQEENRQKGMDFCRHAKAAGADIALFPEMWNIGYALPDSPEEMRRMAIGREDPFLLSYQKLARELDMAVGITYLERYEPQPRNTLTLFDRFGREVLTYAKVHTCDFDVERHLTPGDDFYVAELDTPSGGVRIGAMICYDREFPESARILRSFWRPTLARWRSTACPSSGRGPLRTWWESPRLIMPMGSRTATVIPPPLTASPTGRSAPAGWNPGICWWWRRERRRGFT